MTEEESHTHKAVERSISNHSDEAKKSAMKPRLYINPTHQTVIKVLDHYQ